MTTGAAYLVKKEFSIVTEKTQIIIENDNGNWVMNKAKIALIQFMSYIVSTLNKDFAIGKINEVYYVVHLLYGESIEEVELKASHTISISG